MANSFPWLKGSQENINFLPQEIGFFCDELNLYAEFQSSTVPETGQKVYDGWLKPQI